VRLGSAVWHSPTVETPRLLELVRRLAPPADAGPLPSQTEADAWARERTGGLINKFPLDVARFAVVLATAIASKVSWEIPFEIRQPDDLLLPSDPAFAGRPVLGNPYQPEWCGFVDTEIGLVAGHTARSLHGLFVTSVVADAGAAPTAVLEVAQRVAIAVAAGDPPESRSLFELPLGDGAAWRISESMTSSPGRERYEVRLPAWEAQSDHQLLENPELGFREAVSVLLSLLPPAQYQADAKQRAMARYTREGFEAAAVTAAGVRVSAIWADEHRQRSARIEFTRPHAVVAATSGSGHWDGLPVFAAWVTQAVPAA
ncbi:MAG TPA: hypothetical protein VKB75_07460, partial [Jatrophihabitans sp.]|nr:hypothetical protein [Jatrophihabitans sp.]